jgi:hypothetical protein
MRSTGRNVVTCHECGRRFDLDDRFMEIDWAAHYRDSRECEGRR